MEYHRCFRFAGRAMWIVLALVLAACTASVLQPLAVAPTAAPPTTAPAAPTQPPTASPVPTVVPTAAKATAVASAPMEELAAVIETELAIKKGATGGEPGFEGVQVLPLEDPAGSRPLWVAFTYGLRSFEPLRNHLVAIYTYAGAGWQELSRLALECPDYFGDNSVQQVQFEPGRVWLEAQGGTGAHSGCYDLLSFDGQALREEVTGFNSSPDAGGLDDLNGDGTPEVILNQTENYVFCYACGVRLRMYAVLRWDGTQLITVTLTALPPAAPADLRRLNDRAVELANAELWKGAQEAIAQARALDAQDPTVLWNSVLIQLHAQRRAQEVTEGPYPLLANVFYGDYAAALDVMRAYPVPEIFSPQTPLVVGTPAESWDEALNQWASLFAGVALKAEPNLAAAHFLLGWAAYRTDSADPTALAEIEKAAQLDPHEPLFAQSAAYLKSLALPAPKPSEPAVPLPGARERIAFPPGGTVYAFTPLLKQSVSQGYTLGVLAGQRMFVAASDNTRVELLGAGNQRLAPASTANGALEFRIPSSGDYTVVLQGVGKVSVIIFVPPAGSSSALSPTRERISFPSGGTSATWTTTLAQGTPKGYALRVLAQQHVTVVTDSKPGVTVLDPDGNLLTPINVFPGNVGQALEFAIPRTGDYTLALSGAGEVTVSVTIPPLPGPSSQMVPMPPVRLRITFAPGTSGASITTTLIQDRPHGYVLGAAANQQMMIVVNNPAASLVVADPTGHALAPVHADANGRWEFRLPRTGDYTIILQGTGETTVSVEIPPL